MKFKKKFKPAKQKKLRLKKKVCTHLARNKDYEKNREEVSELIDLVYNPVTIIDPDPDNSVMELAVKLAYATDHLIDPPKDILKARECRNFAVQRRLVASTFIDGNQIISVHRQFGLR